MPHASNDRRLVHKPSLLDIETGRADLDGWRDRRQGVCAALQVKAGFIRAIEPSCTRHLNLVRRPMTRTLRTCPLLYACRILELCVRPKLSCLFPSALQMNTSGTRSMNQ